MSGKEYLQQRNDTWYFRYKVPLKLRHIAGKREYRESLKTTDLKLAKQKRNLRLYEVEKEISKKENEYNQAANLVSDKQSIKIAILHWFHEEAEKQAQEAKSDLNNLSVEELHEYREALKGDSLQHYDKNDESIFSRRKDAETIAAEIIHDYHLNLNQDHPHYKFLLDEITRGNQELYQRLIDHILNEDFTGKVHDEYFNQKTQMAPVQLAANTPSHTVALQELVDKFLENKQEKVTERTHREYSRHCEMLLKYLGRKTLIHTITRDQMEHLAKLLRKFPVNAKQKYGDVPFEIAVNKAEKEEAKTFSPKNHSYYLDSFSSIFEYAVTKGYISYNPARKLDRMQDTKADIEKRYPFTTEQLNWIFSTIKTWKMDKKYRPSLNDYVWIPLICLYTGMRVTECCQLHVEDIKEVEGIWYFDITPTIDPDEEIEGNIKYLKTKAAKRQVPIHSRLIELGYLNKVERAQQKKKTRVLYMSKPDERYRHFRDWFNRNVKKIREEDKTISFHSTRHTARDEMDYCGIGFKMRHALGGWDMGLKTAESKYGTGKRLKKKQKAIEKIRYDGLNLTPVEEFLKCHSK